MKLNIIIPFRPTKSGVKNDQLPVLQGSDYLWRLARNHSDFDVNNWKSDNVPFKTFLENCIKAIRKNSVYHHNIIIASEPDVFFNEKFKQEINDKYDVNFFASPTQRTPKYEYRNLTICSTMKEAMDTVPDEEMICYAYNADLICGKHWDKYIKEAYDTSKDSVVYVPIWIEPRTNVFIHASQMLLSKEYEMHQIKDPLTAENIWGPWQKRVCHSLTMKYPVDRDYMIEKDLDDWSTVCNSANKTNLVEPCGKRHWGYYCCMIAKNKLFKKASDTLLVPGAPDVLFDNNLKTDKIIVVKSHVFHLHNKIRLDDIEVKHES